MDKRMQGLEVLMRKWGHVKLRLGLSSPASGTEGWLCNKMVVRQTQVAAVSFGFTVVTGGLFKVQDGGRSLPGGEEASLS